MNCTNLISSVATHLFRFKSAGSHLWEHALTNA
ncbi:hypothetical protein PF005_g12248 [Phytophthora fragariae]|uniref:Uncharacterized protein n=1 Tax=Phytophthora fragariae TaxID=53985 RepID=A0A6A3XU55_9STRA|nr:hypothetical protein PF005_g12248 [Phytophthora fragariae]